MSGEWMLDPGFYWIKNTADGEWTVGRLDRSETEEGDWWEWYEIGSDYTVTPAVIGQRIDPPR